MLTPSPLLPNRVFVTGIGTDVGKTVASAVLCKVLGARYLKPIQAGLPRDADTVAHLAGLAPEQVLPEARILQTPCSPHEAAAREGLTLSTRQIVEACPLPADGPLVVEGAGGLLVPLNDTETIADLAAGFGLPVVIVWRQYLGSINHTLLTLEAAHARGLNVAGLIISGTENPYSTQAVAARYAVPVLLRIPEAEDLSELFQAL